MAAFLSGDIAEKIGLDYRNRVLFEVGHKPWERTGHGHFLEERNLPLGYYVAWFAYTPTKRSLVIVQRRSIAKEPKTEYFVNSFFGINLKESPEGVKLKYATRAIRPEHQISLNNLEERVLQEAQ